MTHAFKGALGIGVQTGADLQAALVARTRFARYVDCHFDGRYAVEDEVTSGRAEVEDFNIDRYDLKISGVLEGTVEGPITMLLKSLMGTDTITTPGGGINSRDHTLSVADTLAAANRLSAEKKYGTQTVARSANMIVTRMRYDFAQKGMARWHFDALGAKDSRVASATAVTLPSIATRLSRPMHTTTFFGLADNTIRVRSGWWEIRRVLDEDDFVVNSIDRRDASYGRITAQWEVVAEFDNDDQLRRMWGSATENAPKDTLAYYAAVLKGEHPAVIEGALKYTVKFDAPECRIEVDKPQRAADKILQTIRGFPRYASGSSKAFDVLIRNTQTT